MSGARPGATPMTTKLADMLCFLKARDEVPTPLSTGSSSCSSSSSSSSSSASSSGSLTGVLNPSNQQLGNSNELASPLANGDATSSCAVDCNCRKSRCLKLYCQCFAASVTCTKECNCYSCANNKSHDDLRKKAIRVILERNPQAFDSKFAKATSSAQSTEVDSLAHKVGCRCRKSLCLKKYCECYNAGVVCGSTCTCLHCCNTGSAPPAMASVVYSQGAMQSATPIPDNEDAIFKAAEELAFLCQQQAGSSPLVKFTGDATTFAAAPVQSSRPPLPPNKRKRTDSDLGGEGGRKGLRGNAAPPGRYSDMNDGRPPLPLGFSPIAYAGDGKPGVIAFPPTHAFNLRAASPTSINIASALSLLSNSNGRPLAINTDTSLSNAVCSQPTAGTDTTSEDTASEDDWSQTTPGDDSRTRSCSTDGPVTLPSNMLI